MKHEKIIKREDGSRVKILVELLISKYRESYEWLSCVHLCEKRKRTWTSTFSPGHPYRSLSMEDRRVFEHKSQFPHISKEELFDAKLELWQKIKPEL